MFLMPASSEDLKPGSHQTQMSRGPESALLMTLHGRILLSCRKINILLKPQVPGVVCPLARANGMFGFEVGLEHTLLRALSVRPTALASFGFPGSYRN